MRKILTALLIGCVATLCVSADELTINENVPARYTVVKGDTLWDIAEMFLADPWKWQDLWYNNPQIENPHLIYPGDVIALIEIDGQQRLTVIDRGEDANTLVITTEAAGEDGVVKLRPTARATPVLGTIPAIPREYVEGFLSGNRILDTNELESAPYIVSGIEGRLLLGAGDRVYARGEFDTELPAYQIYRIGESYRDPNTREFLGYEAIELGTARLEDIEADIATFELRRSNQQVAIRDRILPSDETLLESIFYPSEPPENLQGEIIDAPKGVSFIGQFDVVLLNVGARDGVEAGNVFRVNRRGERVRDPVNNQRLQLPDENGGMLMVFRTFDRMSYGLILEAYLPMRVGDPILNPGF